MQMPGSECPDVGPLVYIKKKNKTFLGTSDAVGCWITGTIRIKYKFLSPGFLSKVPYQRHLLLLLLYIPLQMKFLLAF